MSVKMKRFDSEIKEFVQLYSGDLVVRFITGRCTLAGGYLPGNSIVIIVRGKNAN